jgi:hypothetical protein
VTPAYEVVLEPVRGDGRLTTWDVELAVTDLPRGAAVVVRLDECDDFEADAPGTLARALSGLPVAHEFGPCARRVAADWLALYERAAAEYLAVEARLLGRGA